jgi:hypothetical protein
MLRNACIAVLVAFIAFGMASSWAADNLPHHASQSTPLAPLSKPPIRLAQYECRCDSQRPKCVINVLLKHYICCPRDTIGCAGTETTSCCLRGCEGTGQCSR